MSAHQKEEKGGKYEPWPKGARKGELAIVDHPVMALHVAVKEASRAQKNPRLNPTQVLANYLGRLAAIIGIGDWSRFDWTYKEQKIKKIRDMS